MLNLLKELLTVGFQFWWPVDLRYHTLTNGDWRVEVILGSILTQNTKWEIVEKVINKMKENKFVFNLDYIKKISEEMLINFIKSIPFNLSKARRIKNLVNYISENYKDLDSFFSLDIYGLRKELLSIKGIGKETADVIILYASEKPIFVVDSYTRRFLFENNIISRINEEYDKIRIIIEKFVESNFNTIFQEFYNELIKINCKEMLKFSFNYDGNIKIKPPLSVCDLKKELSYENKLTIIYKELHAMIDIYMKRNKNKK